jgi:transposase
MFTVPRKFPPEFKRDVVTVARRGDLTVAEVAADFDISPESIRRRMRQADIDDGIRDGLTTAEQSELVQLRRDKRRLEMEVEILRRATAYFAKDAAPKSCSRSSPICRGRRAGQVDVRAPRLVLAGVLQMEASAVLGPRLGRRAHHQRHPRRARR